MIFEYIFLKIQYGDFFWDLRKNKKETSKKENDECIVSLRIIDKKIKLKIRELYFI